MSLRVFERYRPATLDEVIGNRSAKRKLKKWLTGMGVPRTVFFHGGIGTGKTTLMRILSAAIRCENRGETDTNACGRTDCPCSGVLHAGIAWAKGLRCRNGADMSRDSLAEDFGELAYVQDAERPIIFLYDEIHRAPKNVRDSLLTRVESAQDHFHLFVGASAVDELEPAFVQRFAPVGTERPNADEMVVWLREVCEAQSFPLSDSELREIAASETCVPRACLSALWDRASLL